MLICGLLVCCNRDLGFDFKMRLYGIYMQIPSFSNSQVKTPCQHA